MTRKSNWLSDWVGELQQRTQRSVEAVLARPDTKLGKFRFWLARMTGCEMSEADFRDTCAEALAWTIVYSANQHADNLEDILARTAVYSPFVAELLSVYGSAGEFASEIGEKPTVSNDSATDPLFLYESYLAARYPQRRLDRGVFYTPRLVARHIVERVDTVLREQFGLSDGLADTATWSEMRRRDPTLRVPEATSGDEPFVRILDPAAGSGIFLIEVVDRIHRTMCAKWQNLRLDEQEIAARWNAYVPLSLLPRIDGVELMATPGVISQLAIAQKLAETQYDFQGGQRIRCSIADTLLDPAAVAALTENPDSLGEELPQTPGATLSRAAFTVVVGNPPFRGISSNPSSWMGKLLRGTAPGARPVASYYEIDGEPLRERKLWLQDDYVKFMRYAQWQIERAGRGVVGFVTNHGYLDNATFRGMRHAMMSTFQQIEVFDLHGNRKKSKTAPDGGSDEGMFEIEQGVAIGVFSRTATHGASCVTHRELWGKRATKVLALQEDHRTARTRANPLPPNYLFVPTRVENYPEYEAGFALNDIMPVNSTAVVTARDRFVVGFDNASLAERMRAFCDGSVSDAEIRRKFFTNGRSTKYPPGDTRGWKLADARRRMMQEPDWASFLRPCLYRPFDRRVIFWADWMIDWPRQEITRHMLARPNIALVARRQMPPTGDCNHFWITDTIALDGLIRSDNRGSESIFPLWRDATSATGQANLAPQFVAEIASRIGLTWDEFNTSATGNRFGPMDVLHYIYGLFTAPTYRQRYSERLRRDFPRVLIPRRRSVWTAFCDIGERLTDLHLNSPGITAEPSAAPGKTLSLDAGYPKFARGQIWLGREGPVFPASEAVWNFHAGTHHVCRKWLLDRRGYNAVTLSRYERIVAAIAKTIDLTNQLDAAVAAAGGWEAAFVP